MGIVLLQLFHPMNTDMEINKTLLDCKKQLLPEKFTRESPLISQLILKMIQTNPDDRPTL